VVAGVALSFKQKGERRVVMTWIGDGATKTTASHEGINLAAVLRLPVIYVLQNNQIALGTRVDQHQAGPFSSWGQAYGVSSFVCHGNNVLDVYAATRLAARLCREGKGPAIIIPETFRMGGHATHDEREARAIFSPELFDHWGKRDPIGMYEIYLQRIGVSREQLESVENHVIGELALAEKDALASRETHMPRPESALDGVYASA
jgi:TPP-dependent pyruvate/acetoin dehydrogenase alpha subunit